MLKNCWFCNNRFESEESNLIFPMYRIISEERHIMSTSVKYEKANITIPRCIVCQKNHIKASRIGYVPTAFLTFITLYCLHIFKYINYYINPEIFYILGFIFLLVFSGVVSIFTESYGFKDSKPYNFYNEFPIIKKFKNEGWEFGDSPPKRR
jgi:hypothetical protein